MTISPIGKFIITNKKRNVDTVSNQKLERSEKLTALTPVPFSPIE